MQFSIVQVGVLSCLFVVLSFSNTFKVADQTLEEMIRETCLEKTGYKPLEDNVTYFRVVEAVPGSEVMLTCSYCGESAEDVPHMWEWRPRVENSSIRAVELGLAPRLEDNRLYTYPNHTLVISNVSMGDTGIYYCRSLVETETTVFQFSVDLVKSVVVVVKQSDKTSWESYNSNNVLPVNKVLYEGSRPELDGLFDKVKIKVTSEWDPWMPCDGCSSLRRRYAKCRLRPKLNRVKYPDILDSNLNQNQLLLHQAVVISCHSLDLHRWYSYLYSITSVIPNFMQEEPCFGDCLPEVRTAHQPKYYLQVQLYVGSSYSFICPESDIKSKVVWRKDGVVMKPIGAKKIKKKKKKALYKYYLGSGTEEFKIENAFVDRLNVLQLCMVGFKETGLFVCYVNHIPIKAFNVSVVVSSESQRERYYHFWLLSIYTSTISTIIVSVGVAYKFFFRRHEFDQSDLVEPLNCKYAVDDDNI